MNNYEFKFISTDNYELRYTDKDKNEKVIPFTRTIEMASKLQSIEKRARLSMYKDLTEMGMTKDDLVVVKEINGKRIYDESNYVSYEQNYMDLARYEIINEIFELCFKKNLNDLLIDMGLTEKSDPKQVELFSNKFATIIIGKDKEETPSGSNKEESK